MSSGALHRLTEKKGKQLSKFLGIDSVPSTRLIANMQARINNPIFKLSIEDYEAMCGNKRMIRMMSKVIGCEEKQLKKFCKYINVFAENIKSSPKSIKNKMKVTKSINASKRKGSLHVLPDDILEKIVEKYKTIFKIKYKLKDWIPKYKLNWDYLHFQNHSIELLKENPTKINWRLLSGNPSAIKLLKTKINEENEISEDDYNDLDKSKKIYWPYLSLNPNPEAIELLKANLDKIDWYNLSKNPNSEAIELLKKYPEKIDWSELSDNPSPEAIKLLKANLYKIHWSVLSENPSAIELLKENQDKIDWDVLSANPNAIELLKENQDKIDWDVLSTNPKAIELLKENQDKIGWDWFNLSANPSAIELLNANPDEINWYGLSLNPNPEAIELLKENQDKIDWYRLSENPSAIELLKENQDKIEWNALSSNPAIFDEILE